MSYPRNAATPKAVVVGSVVLIADGTVQTSACSVRVNLDGGGWGAGGGTLAYDATSGVVTYAPIQAETNGDVLEIAVYKASCLGCSVTVLMDHIGIPQVVAGEANGLFIAGTNAETTITTALNANLIGDITGDLSGSVGSVTGAVGSVTGAVGSVTGSVGSVAGNVDGSVASVVGAVGSVTGAVGSVTGAVGSVTGSVGSVAGNVDGSVASIGAGGIVAASFAANALVAATFAASSLDGKGDWNTVVPDAAGVVAALLPTNFADMAIEVTTGVVKATDEDGTSLATKKSRLPR